MAYLRFKLDHSHSHLWRVHQEPSDSMEGNGVLTDEYVWGIELIAGLLSHAVDRLKITEEINYYQSRLFNKITLDLCDKRSKA